MDALVQGLERGFDLALASEWLWRAALAIALLVVGMWLARWLTRILDRLMLRFEVEDILRSFLRNVVYAICMVVVFVAALDYLGVPTTSLLAVLGAAGLAIGLALKDSLSNIASGVMLIALRPFRIGDQVQIAGLEGVVESVRIFQTRMVTGDNREIILPNSQITTAPIINYTGRGERRVDLDVPIAFGDNLDALRQAMLALAARDPRVKPAPRPEVLVIALGESAMTLQLRAWAPAGDYVQLKSDLLEAVLGEFNRLGLRAPMPRREVHVHHHGAVAASPTGLDDALKSAL